MSNDLKCKPVGNLILIKAKVREKSSAGILLPYKVDDIDATLNRRKETLIMDETVVAVGDEVKYVKVGNKVYTFKSQLRFINSEKCSELGLKRENDELYFIANEEDNILAIIN